MSPNPDTPDNDPFRMMHRTKGHLQELKHYPRRMTHYTMNWVTALGWLTVGLLMTTLVGCTILPSQAENRLRLAAHTLRADDWSLARAHEAGFDTIVQVFAWREIEPTPGEFHWEVTDQIVAGTEYYGLDLVVRLDQQPFWASEAVGFNAPPQDQADYGHFVKQVAQRYRGRVKAYIIWNEPNLALDWGGLPPDPDGYVELLRVGYEAVKATDPTALVVSAGLAPTNNRDDDALDDRDFLQGMYQAGAAPYFDVLGAHPYGGTFPPEAPAEVNDGLVMGRLADLRAIMTAHNDGHKPVWITELGWTVAPPPEQLDLKVGLSQQAAYLDGALERIEREWPWVELVTVWNLSRLKPEHPFAGYSLFEVDGAPRPAYRAWQEAVGNRGRTSLQSEQGNTVPILGEDVIIHLGDTDLKPPWWPLFAGRKPSLTWTGGFYLPDPGDVDWELRLELMQQNEIGATIDINGVTLSPDLPTQDFTRRWLAVSRIVPIGALLPGYNELTVTTVRLAPDLQHDDFVWDDFQIRNVRLERRHE